MRLEHVRFDDNINTSSYNTAWSEIFCCIGLIPSILLYCTLYAYRIVHLINMKFFKILNEWEFIKIIIVY